MQPIRLREKARLEREAWNPESAESEFVWHFSIPNFDDGAAKVEEVATIKSGKTLITKPCVLVSKLNPRTPRVWLIEHLKPGVNVCSTEFLVVAPLDSRDLRYLYFVLKSPSAVSRLAAVASGSSTSHQRVRPSEVEALELGWEESSSRRQWVADCLWEIEEKIKANRNTSRTLEELAAALFKSWFIDFAPVKAKMAAQEPVGMDAETAALFSDSMEDSELGEIPAGWSVGTLVDFFNLVMGQSPPGSAYNSEGGGEPFFQGRAEFGERFPTQRLSSTLGNRRATKGDVLVSVRAPVGDQNQALVDCIIGRGLAAIRHKSGSQAYSYEFVRSIQGQLDFFNGQGSVFGSISKRDFESLQVLEPPDALIQAFDSICSPIDELLRNLHVQNESLAGIRDALLPRLVSGELEIPDEILAA